MLSVLKNLKKLRERQISYDTTHTWLSNVGTRMWLSLMCDITCNWNLKKRCKLICKTETDSQILKTNLCGGGEG